MKQKCLIYQLDNVGCGSWEENRLGYFGLEHDLSELFASNILVIDHAVADRWGYVAAKLSRPLPVVDVLKLVTRNVRDFAIPGLEVINPFTYP